MESKLKWVGEFVFMLLLLPIFLGVVGLNVLFGHLFHGFAEYAENNMSRRG